MWGNKLLIIMDLDGTLFDDFYESDRKIIEEIFDNNKLVLFVDSAARIINNIGIVKNNMKMLKLRLFAYSILSFKNLNYVIKNYKEKYIYFARKALNRNKHFIRDLEKKGFEVLILSNNVYSAPLKDNFNVTTVKNKRNKIKHLYSIYKESLSFVVGDNFFDDILPARSLGICNIYIQKKVLSKKKLYKYRNNKCYYCDDVLKAFDIIIKS